MRFILFVMVMMIAGICLAEETPGPTPVASPMAVVTPTPTDLENAIRIKELEIENYTFRARAMIEEANKTIEKWNKELADLKKKLPPKAKDVKEAKETKKD